jgi:hypothetical protein
VGCTNQTRVNGTLRLTATLSAMDARW